MSIELLNEVIRQNPYKEVDAKGTWIEIAISVTEMWNDPQKKLSDRTAKQHTETCLKNYKAWKAESKKKYDVGSIVVMFMFHFKEFCCGMVLA